MAVVALVSCVKSKQPGCWPARDLYCSTWFKAAIRYAERNSERFGILSAKYGLLLPDEEVEHYEETLSSKRAVERREWAQLVVRQLATTGLLQYGDEVLWLAGKRYREYLVELLQSHSHRCPLQHLRQGQQIQWLQQKNAQG